MKRVLIFLSLAALLLCGCTRSGERIKDPVSFYYLQAEYQYGTEGSVIASEEREASGHRQDLLYLMKLYMMGPAGEELRSPLPRGIQVLSAEAAGDLVTLTISDTAGGLSDIDFSLAGACLSLTCFDLTEAAKVTIISGERSLTFSQDTLNLYDSIPAATEDTK